MPIYEFVCESCGHEFEKILAFSATKTPSCPACQSEQVNRQMSRPAIHFKGSGWYITDSKAVSKVSANGTDKEQSGSNEQGTGDGASSEKSSDGTGTNDGKSNDGKISDSKSNDSKSEVKTINKNESIKANTD